MYFIDKKTLLPSLPATSPMTSRMTSTTPAPVINTSQQYNTTSGLQSPEPSYASGKKDEITSTNETQVLLLSIIIACGVLIVVTILVVLILRKHTCTGEVVIPHRYCNLIRFNFSL